MNSGLYPAWRVTLAAVGHEGGIVTTDAVVEAEGIADVLAIVAALEPNIWPVTGAHPVLVKAEMLGVTVCEGGPDDRPHIASASMVIGRG